MTSDHCGAHSGHQFFGGTKRTISNDWIFRVGSDVGYWTKVYIDPHSI
jgi:hypothetical protein